MELKQIDLFGIKIGATLIKVGPEVGFGIALLGLAIGRRRPDAGAGRGLRGNEDLTGAAGVPAFPQDLPDKPLAAPISVAGGGIDESASQIEGPIQGGDRITVALVAPAAADRPGTKADFRAGDVVFSEGTGFHGKGR